MKEIGGYFGLEIKPHNNFPLSDGVYLNSGRSALGYLLVSLKKISTLYIPYFTCDAVLDTVKSLNINAEFYSINNELEINQHITLKDTDYLIYTNYFGIKSEYIHRLIKKYGQKLIIDNAQALYDKPPKGVSTFYSPRKFVGIPDGGIAFPIQNNTEITLNQDYSYERCSHLLMRLDKGASFGYTNFKNNSIKIKEIAPSEMSELTKSLISGIDFHYIYNKRRDNFIYLHKKLEESNSLKINIDEVVCPMVYPYRTTDTLLRTKLVANKIFIATYWPNVLDWCKKTDLEYQLAETILPLPIDQRYDIEDMDRIYSIISK